MLSYPAFLPAPLKSDRSFQMVDPLVSTPFQNGQTRWDRQYTDVPTTTPVSWVFTDAECALFRTWYVNVVNWGAEWFEMPLRADDGRETRQCHFVQGYSGPTRLGFDRWRVSANLILRRLPVTDPDWLLLPEYMLQADIFDRAVNENWPLNPWQTYILETDTAINQEWPTP